MTLKSIPAGKLTKRQAAPKVGSIISPHRASVVDTLSPQRLGAIMREADEGSVEAYLTLAEEMEEREPHYLSVLGTRKMAVSGIVPRVESPKDAVDPKIISWVEDRIVKPPAFEGLITDLLDGIAKGFSCVEIDWQRDESEWWPKGYLFREQRHFTFDKDEMVTPLLRTDDAALDEQGVPLWPFKWIVHKPKLRSGIPIRTGIARTIAVTYACKRWAVADWMAFLDIYGIPLRIGKYPNHMKELKSKLLRAVRALGSDAAAVIPKEMEVEIIEAKGGTGGSSTFFQQSAEYWDKQTSKVVVGQTMTTDDGSSLAQAKVHETVRFDIRDADSRSVCATVNRDLIKPGVDLNFGPQKTYPEVVIRQRKSEDLVPLLQATKIYVDLGGRVQASEVRDRLGYMEPEEGAELLKPAAKVTADAQPKKQPGEPDDGASKDDGPAEDDDEIEGDKRDAELNADKRARTRTYDATDEQTEAELAEWRSLADDNIGRAMRIVQEAGSYEDARARLEELAKDEGDVLDIALEVLSLARSTFKLRGNGDATDEVKP
jgi:phage gp29-like protein